MSRQISRHLSDSRLFPHRDLVEKRGEGQEDGRSNACRVRRLGRGGKAIGSALSLLRTVEEPRGALAALARHHRGA